MLFLAAVFLIAGVMFLMLRNPDYRTIHQKTRNINKKIANAKLYYYLSLAILITIIAGYLAAFPISERSRVSLPVEQVCTFAKTTSQSVIFLTNPTEAYWRLCLERAIVVDFQAIPSNDKILYEWYERMRDVTNKEIPAFDHRYNGFNIDFDKYYTDMNASYIQDLSQKYNITYAIFRDDKKLDFPIVFANSEYIIYEITPH